MLQTAEVNLFNKPTCAEVEVKLLFDSGSERSYISRRAQNTLNLTPFNSEKLRINTFGNANSKASTVQRENFFIKTADEKLIETEVYTSLLVCLPLQNQPLQIARKHFKHLNLNFGDKGNLDGEIDLLICSDKYWQFLTSEVKLWDREGLVAINSLFGWVLSGSIGVKSEELETTNLRSTHVLFSGDIAGYENSFSRFWGFEVLKFQKRRLRAIITILSIFAKILKIGARFSCHSRKITL